MKTITAVFSNFKCDKAVPDKPDSQTRGLLHVVVFVLTIFAVFSGLFKDSADANVGLTACPSNLVFTAPPGFNEIKIIKISNCGSEITGIKAYIVGASENANGKIVFNNRYNEVASGNSWLRVEPDEFTLKPKSSRYVRVTAKTPSSLIDKKRFAGVGFAVNGQGQSKISISGNVVSTIKLIPQTAGIALFEIEEFDTGKINVGSPAGFSFAVRNTGKVGYKTQGKIEIRTLEGKLVSALDLPGVEIPPAATKTIEVEAGKTLPVGAYKCSLLMTEGDFYKSSIEKRLIVFPWVGLLGVAIAAIGVVMMTRIGRSRPGGVSSGFDGKHKESLGAAQGIC